MPGGASQEQNLEGLVVGGMPPGHGSAARVNRRELAQLLRAFRKHRNETVELVETRLQQALSGGAATDFAFGSLLFATGVVEMESAEEGAIELDLGAFEFLAEVYKIPRLMLDPLLSVRAEGNCLVQSRDEFLEVGSARAPAYYGDGACYAVAGSRLQGAEEVAVVRLELQRGGHSDAHAHPGDELLYVREGNVEVRLLDTGLWTRLGPGDYVHFDAEQLHGAWNVGDGRAELFILRFYQLGPEGTRAKFLASLRAQRPSPNLLRRARTELAATVAPFTKRGAQRGPQEVVDRFGLARLLALVCSRGFQRTARNSSLKDLEKRARWLGYEQYHKGFFDRLHHGEKPVEVEELPRLAEVYGVEPMLLFEFVYPAFRNAVAVRQPADWDRLPEEFLGGQGVIYSLPRRRLADSDLAIASVELGAGAETPLNRHPGQEILLPLEGAIEVRFGEARVEANSTADAFVHYHSGTEHRVINPAIHPARLLVVRLYG